MEYRDRQEKRGSSRTERSRSPERPLIREKDGAQPTPRCAPRKNKKKKLISSILSRIPSCSEGFLLQGTDVPPLKAEDCPGFTGVKIRVLEKDPLDAAIELANNTRSGSDTSNAVSAAGDTPATIPEHGRTCLLNTAIAQQPKDLGFVKKLTQDKSIYERSTLFETLREKNYPVPRKTAVYSPSVVIFGDSQEPTCEFKSLEDPASLPLVSVISTPAIVRPRIRAVRTYVVKADRKGVVRPIPSYEQLYHFKSERRAVKESIRVLLRISASKKHRRIVVSVLGFDEYMHPKEDSANCWAEVFEEPEFQGGWWTDVVFAVLDPPLHPERNYAQGYIYINRLDGLAVSPP
ncbi:hypothetical protein TMEN_6358 [Trichophyton mentagrophytes]|nr:hypothetical protein TMEN_6358 [Trichophyton mentagrophytes]